MQRTKKKIRKKNLTNTRPCLQIESGLCRNFEKIFELGYFRVALSLCLKARLNAKFILVQIKLILVFTRKVSHLVSFWTVEFLKFGNAPIVFQRICI